ncbi:hypothetical protein ACWGR4_05500 [Embleya sp. NPDC055664]|uniref:hypothetical protein n=1 Tax=Embleya sp. NPDC059237 TaxID=3346784 RepID=UPI00367A48B4
MFVRKLALLATACATTLSVGLAVAPSSSAVAATPTTAVAESARPAAAAYPCWAYTFVDWGVPTAGSQCKSGTVSWQHRVVATFHKAGVGTETHAGPWVGGNSKSYVSVGYNWFVTDLHVEQELGSN